MSALAQIAPAPIPDPPKEVDPKEVDPVLWAVGLASYFEKLHNPVVATYASADIAVSVCARNGAAGSAVFRQALAGVNRLADSAIFNDSRQVLPISSFSGLWKFVTVPALKCDPGLAQLLNDEKAQAKIQNERRHANETVQRALGLMRLESEPDRAAQLADAALAAGDPLLFDVDALSTFLCKLRDLAPDLADDLFPKALEFVMSAAAPSPAQLAELGNYLFTAPQYLLSDDKEKKKETLEVGSSSFPNLTAIRQSANPDDVRSYIEATIQLLNTTQITTQITTQLTTQLTTQITNYDPVVSYAIAYQMVPKANDLGPDLAEPLNTAIQKLLPEIGGRAAQVAALLGSGGVPDINEGGQTGVQLYRAVGRIIRMVRAGRFAEARNTLPEIHNGAPETQVGALIDFSESRAAVQNREFRRAADLANRVQGEATRSLLYAGVVPLAPPQIVLEEVYLAVKETESLSPEQRVAMLSAIGSAIAPFDGGTARWVASQAVKAQNDASLHPHSRKFDPKSIHRIFNPDSDASTDATFIVFGKSSVYEAVQAGIGRYNFRLEVPGVRVLRLPNFIEMAKSVDPDVLEAILVDIHDETRQAEALNALARLRLKSNSVRQPKSFITK